MRAEEVLARYQWRGQIVAALLATAPGSPVVVMPDGELMALEEGCGHEDSGVCDYLHDDEPRYRLAPLDQNPTTKDEG